jgi:hypothetical protein
MKTPSHILKNFDLESWIKKHQFDFFVETGTGLGHGVAHATQFPFQKIFSVEIIHGLAMKVALNFVKDHRITIIHGKSISSLKEVLWDISPEEKGIFFLDSRWPGAEYSQKNYDYEKNIMIRFPLWQELDWLKSKRRLDNDIFIINEWRLYEPEQYDLSDLPQMSLPPPILQNHGKIEDFFRETHQIYRSFDKGGTVCALPLTLHKELSSCLQD